jgi:hypothetical protein
VLVGLALDRQAGDPRSGTTTWIGTFCGPTIGTCTTTAPDWSNAVTVPGVAKTPTVSRTASARAALLM